MRNPTPALQHQFELTNSLTQRRVQLFQRLFADTSVRIKAMTNLESLHSIRELIVRPKIADQTQ